MNAEELKNDMELVNSSIDGEINAQWGDGMHFWFSITQLTHDDDRTYVYSYECCDDNNCGCAECYSFDSLDDLFREHGDMSKYIIGRCAPFPDIDNVKS